MRTAFRSCVAATVSAALLAGCSGPLVRSAITSNIVQEDAHNAYLVLNIARAHERMPMHFTQVNAVRASPGGGGLGTPIVGLDIPFGGAAAPYYALRPTLESASAVDTVSLVSQEFMNGLTTPVDARLMTYFASQGWPLPILLYMFVGAVETYDSHGNLLHNLVNSPRNETFPAFGALVDVVAGCRLVLSESTSHEFFGEPFPAERLADVGVITTAKNAGLVPVEVDAEGRQLAAEPGTRKAGAPRYYRLAQVTREAGVKLDSYGSGKSGIAGAADCAIDGNAVQAAVADAPADAPAALSADSGTASAAGPAEPPVADTLKQIGKALSTLSISVGGPGDKRRPQDKPADPKTPAPRAAAGPDIAEARLVLRSTQSMMYYLGELSRYQNATDATRIEPVAMRIGRHRQAYLFRMQCCQPAPGAAVAVNYRDKHFSVPPYAESAGTGREDRSVQTLALLSLVYTLQNRSAAPPAVSNVRVLNR
ncbi:hypothetical protein [Pseudoduganella umbonata]|uniref:Uncharacterized protein n=1 Tax=Pseudoduganella umbonata TaxID=864828 RepID=A0A4V1EE31_9BURK|nr:hypothetical protein [Pseudoduganella umbonata]MBB3223062.1 hypothetical protein [Pseudoduganella umbonata]QCP13161.1 hypothetical protein FCL38_24000 [Pseudoduganella umbonata]